MEDVIAVVLVFGGFFSFLLAISPVGRAFADRIRGGGAHGPNELSRRMDDLVLEVEALRQDVAETLERVDFVERMLARNRDVPQLPGGEGKTENGESSWN